MLENVIRTVYEQFRDVKKLLKSANSASVTIIDFNLSRYTSYLIVQDSDLNKEVVALGKTCLQYKLESRN